MQHVKVVDPSELSNRFAEGIRYVDIEYASEDSIRASLDEILPLLDRLPPREADILKLFFISKKKQVELAKIFKVTQAAICYRINRGIQRIRFLLEIPEVEPQQMKSDLLKIFKQDDVVILLLMYKTTCQSKVAKEIGSTQCSVRHRFLKAIKVLDEKRQEESTFLVRDKETEIPEALRERFDDYHTLFTMISKNLNILHEITHPQWKAVDAVID